MEGAAEFDKVRTSRVPRPFNVVTAVRSKTLWSAKVYWSLLTALDYRRGACTAQVLLSR